MLPESRKTRERDRSRTTLRVLAVLSRILGVSCAFLRRFDTTSKFQNLFTRHAGRKEEISTLFLYILYPRVILTAYPVATNLQFFKNDYISFKNVSHQDFAIEVATSYVNDSRFLHFCSVWASVVVTISLRSEFCTAHREGKRGCPRASLSMAFLFYEGGGWIRTPKGEMAHSDALIQHGP